ncbi:MAG: peptidylprolyl isomerase [Cyclobacteriaceae bacterium]|nr:peptidylprolyl isomerase [Cyclobacteriaceae bacterium]
MGLINKIRQRTGLAVGIVAVGLGLFVVGGDILGPNSAILGKQKTDVGEISGVTIDVQQFNEQIEELKYNFTINYGRNPNESEMNTIRQQAWDYIIVKTAFQKEYDKLGIEVTDEEHVDMVQGNNISSEIIAAFSNPETGEFDKEQVVQYLQMISQMPPQQQAAWYLFERGLKPARLRVKFDNMLVKTSYATEAEAEHRYQEENSVAEIKYLYVPFYSISDSLVQVTEAEMRAHLRENSVDYQIEESRNISYISLPIRPSREDSLFIRQDIEKLAEELRTVDDDSVFARMNSDAAEYFGRYLASELPQRLQVNVSNLSEGDVRGPYMVDGNYTVYKVSRISEDDVYSAKASHILITWEDESASAKTEARNRAEGLLRQLRGGTDFAQLARENSEDPGSSVRGGDLGWFMEGQMVKPFEDAVFGATRTGLVPNLVESQFGYHIINVTGVKDNTLYHVAKVTREITPSDPTRDRAFRKADYFAGTSSNFREFTENAIRDSLIILTADGLGKNDRRVGNLANAREIIRWSYNEASRNEVSQVFEVNDHFVVAVLREKVDKGIARFEDVKDQLEQAVKDKKKGELIIKKLGELNGSLEEIAASYGQDARVYTSNSLKLSSNTLPSVGFVPAAIGKAFGLNDGQRTQPFAEEAGVLVIEMIAKTKAPAIADYSTYKNQIEQQLENRTSFSIGEAIRDQADIKDRRYRFY